MLLISYDISNDKVRTKFAKYLSKYGFRLQYSVFEITNSEIDDICNTVIQPASEVLL